MVQQEVVTAARRTLEGPAKVQVEQMIRALFCSLGCDREGDSVGKEKERRRYYLRIETQHGSV